MAKTVNDLVIAQQEAGERYALALAELREAFVELAAHDHAVDNLKKEQRSRSFDLGPSKIHDALRHPIYAPNGGDRLIDAVAPRAQQLIRHHQQ